VLGLLSVGRGGLLRGTVPASTGVRAFAVEQIGSGTSTWQALVFDPPPNADRLIGSVDPAIALERRRQRTERNENRD